MVFIMLAKHVRHLHPRILFYRYTRLKSFRELAHCIHLIAMVGLHKLKKKTLRRYSSMIFIRDLFKNSKLDSDLLSFSLDIQQNNDLSYTNSSLYNFLIIYVTCDKSCSGFVNGGVLRNTLQLINQIKLKSKNVRLISIGKKGYNALKRKYKTDFFKIFLDLDLERNSFAVSFVILYKFMKLDFDKAFLIFNSYVNFMIQQISYYSIYSFSFFFKKIFIDQYKNKFYKRLISLNKIDDYHLIDLYKYSVTLIILDSLRENLFSEVAYRARTMDTIVKNVDELINFYWLNYQNARQRVITDEIIEILNGANVANEYSVDVNSFNKNKTIFVDSDKEILSSSSFNNIESINIDFYIPYDGSL